MEIKNLKIYNVLRKNTMGIIVGGLVVSGITTINAINNYNAYSIKYNGKDDSSTVGDALNELYSMNSNKTKLIYLGEGTSFDISNINGYKQFTVDNFIIGTTKITNSIACSTAIPYYDWGQGWVGVSATCNMNVSSTIITPSYDSETGMLTIKATNCTPFVYLINSTNNGEI